MLKTITFPKNNWLSLKTKLPEPRYTDPSMGTEGSAEKDKHQIEPAMNSSMQSSNIKSTQQSTLVPVSYKRSAAESIKAKNY